MRQAPKKANHLSLKVVPLKSRVLRLDERATRRRRIAYEITGGPNCANVCEMTSKNLSRFADYSRTVVERTRSPRGDKGVVVVATDTRISGLEKTVTILEYSSIV